MIFFNKRIVCCGVLGLCLSLKGHSQTVAELGTYLTPQEAKIFYADSINRHSSMRPYVLGPNDDVLRPIQDTVKNKSVRQWVDNKLFNQHLLQVKGDEYFLYFDFMPDWQTGVETGYRTGNILWLNTRGFQFGGNITKKFAFYTSFFENQGSFPAYINDKVRSTGGGQVTGVGQMPGQGEARYFKDGKAWDYAYSAGRISYTPNKYFNLDVGYDKNFIGDGYRSLLLSDAATPYPYIKLTTTVWKLRYMIMWGQFIDQQSPKLDYELGYPKEWGVFHYLDWAITKKFSLGLFENIMWADMVDGYKRGFDWTYLNPLLFFRPAMFASGSPDKCLLGFNMKYKAFPNKATFYGQFILNEFTAKEFFAGNGYGHNKWGYQFGVRTFNVFGIKNLQWQLENNLVRPYTYSARGPIGVENPTYSHNKYAHASEALAHPWGANFIEGVSIVNYYWERWGIRWQSTFGYYGLDTDDGYSYGKDILKPYDQMKDIYGNKIGQGLTTKLFYNDFKVFYVLNPKYNLRFETGITRRYETNEEYTHNTVIFNIGLRSSFRNLYYDF